MRRSFLLWLAFLAGIVLLWQAALSARLVSPAALAAPGEVARALPAMLSPGGSLPDALATAWFALIAFLASVPLGIGLGLAIFFAGEASSPAEFFLDFLRSIPATALVPVFLIVFGIGSSTKVAVGAFSSTLVICLATISGLRGRNKTRLGVAQVLGMTGFRRVALLDLPEAAPHIFLGLRAGISLALILVVVSEMLIGSTRGLGRVIADMRYTDDLGRLYAAILLAGAIGYSYNLGLRRLERRLLHWRDG